MTSPRDIAPQSKIAWRIPEWTRETGISRAVIYRLLAAGELRSVLFSKRRLILTTPREFFETLEKRQAA